MNELSSDVLETCDVSLSGQVAQLLAPLTPDPSPRSTGARGEMRGCAAFQNSSPPALRINASRYVRLLLALCLGLTSGQSAVAQ